MSSDINDHCTYGGIENGCSDQECGAEGKHDEEGHDPVAEEPQGKYHRCQE